jgi:hypothetical protein
MPTAEDMAQAQKEVREWYRNHLIKVHGNGCPSLIERVVELTPYDEVMEMFSDATGKYIGPYSAY